jgi:hypothetical protein
MALLGAVGGFVVSGGNPAGAVVGALAGASLGSGKSRTNLCGNEEYRLRQMGYSQQVNQRNLARIHAHQQRNRHR